MKLIQIGITSFKHLSRYFMALLPSMAALYQCWYYFYHKQLVLAAFHQSFVRARYKHFFHWTSSMPGSIAFPIFWFSFLTFFSLLLRVFRKHSTFYYLHESVEAKGQDISPFDEFLAALVAFFFSYFFQIR
jgi:hypothetical protein